MQRRTFIKKATQLAPVLLVAPATLTTACKDDLQPGIGRKVIVVGAGLAGIVGAQELINKGFEIQVLEASDRWGGRIRVLNGFADFPIELGAEEIHGQKTDWHDLVKDNGAQFADDNETDLHFFEGRLWTETEINSNAKAQSVFDLVDNKIDNYSGADKAVSTYVAEQGIDVAYRPFANALIGNEHGTSNEQISIKYLAEENNLWSAGEKNFLIGNKSYVQIIEQAFPKALATIKLNTVVKTIDYSGEKVKVTDANGQTYEGDQILITVPLPILRDGDITFVPELPADKKSAASKIGMGAGSKIILKFNNRFWPEDLGSLYTDGIIPEFWYTSHGRGSVPVLTGFVMAERAEQLAAMGTNAVNTILADLDGMFGTAANPQPATNSYLDSNMMHWANMPFVRGVYSFPLVDGGGVATRKTLAAPIDKKVFFAGEATHFEGHNGTMHGAYESAIRAIDEMI
jgi:monoamine oxidase